jgi:hypothetical protein
MEGVPLSGLLIKEKSGAFGLKQLLLPKFISTEFCPAPHKEAQQNKRMMKSLFISVPLVKYRVSY